MSLGEDVLKELKSEITENEYNHYIKQLSYVEKKSKEDLVYFCASNPLIANWIKTKYATKIAHIFKMKTGTLPIIVIEHKKGKKTHPSHPAKSSSEQSKNSLLNPAYTFDNFVVGTSNQFAFSAAKSVAEKPGLTYNPLFIHGDSGLGKTHLIQAIGNYMQLHNKSVIYVTVEQFLNDYTYHIRKQIMDKFQDKYRKCDLFLLDDIQFLSGKEGTQEALFHTFEALKNIDKQIVFTADKHPKQIAGLVDRLKSRFEWGLVADIQPPELETKIAIIKKKCELNRVILGNDVVNYIATIIENNTREIEGILSKLHAYSQLMHIDINIEFAKNVLKEQLREKRDNVTIDLIMKTVAKELNVKPSEIRSKSRSRNIVNARRISIYLVRSLTPYSLTDIAKYFGMKDHTAVSHTMKKINELLEQDEDFKVKVDSLSNKVTAQ